MEKALKEGSSVSSVPPAVAKVLGGTVDDKGQGNAQMHGPGGAQKAAKEDRPEVMELSISLKMLSTQLADEIKQGKVEVSMTPRGIVVSLKQAAFFPSGTDAVEPATMSTMEKVAGALKAVENPVRIEGHTDSVPIHTPRFRSNWDLSAARSIAIMEVLANRFRDSFPAPVHCRLCGYRSGGRQRYARGTGAQPPRGPGDSERLCDGQDRARSGGAG